MKRILWLFVFAAMLFTALPVWGQGSVSLQLCTDESTNTGPGTCRFLRFLQGNSAGLGTISLLPTAAALYKWDNTAGRFVRWDGTAGSATTPGVIRLMDGDSTTLQDVIAAFADNQVLTLNGAMTGSVGYAYDGATLDMFRQSAAGDTLPADSPGLHSLGFNLFYDGTNYRRWEGDAAGDSLSATQTAPYTLGLNLFYDGSNYRRWQGVTMADNLTLPAAPFVGSVMLGYDGATLDMLQVDGTGALEVVDTSTRAGEDTGNDWRSIHLKGTLEYDPAVTTTAGIGAASTNVLAATDVSGQRKCCLYLQNDDAANPFTDALIQFGPNTTDMPTAGVGNGSWTACDSLAAGETCFYCWDDAHGAVAAEVTGAGGATVDVDARLHCTQ